MKWIISILVLLLATKQVSAQLQFDKRMLETRILNRKAQVDNLKLIEKSVDSISTRQKNISINTAIIEELQDKFLKTMTKVEGILQEGESIIYITKLSKDIIDYQTEIANTVFSDPKLSVIAASLQEEVIIKLSSLTAYTYDFILLGGEKNMMTPTQRIELIDFITQELRELRGALFVIKGKLWYAKKYGFLRTASPKAYRLWAQIKRKQQLKNLLNSAGYGNGLDFY